MINKKQGKYWKNLFGVDFFKIDYCFKELLYRLFGLKLPKLKDQHGYWTRRGNVYMEEIINSGYLDREIFFQNLLIDRLRELDFNSFIEAGCGFGWNIKRVKSEFTSAEVYGLDFSFTQLQNGRRYISGSDIALISGDNCSIPLKNDTFDVVFSLGVFMNIHHSKIKNALRELMRISKKYIIHLEYDENNTTAQLRKKRSFKTNIISHDYKSLYESLGAKVVSFLTYKDFGEAYEKHQKNVDSLLNRWEGFEGAEKYIWIMVEV